MKGLDGMNKLDWDRLEQQFRFILEIDKEKRIMRQTYLSNGIDRENDAEHAWHMAVMTMLLAEYSNEKIDVAKTIMLLLIHDLVEVDAGDTYAYDETAKQTQQEREEKAAERIFSILPEDQKEYINALWQEFEQQQTPEAKFARVMDNIQPMMLNASVGGKGWAERGVRLSQILKRNSNTKGGSETLWEYAKETYLRPNLERGTIEKDCELD